MRAFGAFLVCLSSVLILNLTQLRVILKSFIISQHLDISLSLCLNLSLQSSVFMSFYHAASNHEIDDTFASYPSSTPPLSIKVVHFIGVQCDVAAAYCPVPTGPYCPAPAAEAEAKKKKSSRTANATMPASSSRFASTTTTTGSVHDFAAADAPLVPSHLDSVDLHVPVVWRSAMSVASTAL